MAYITSENLALAIVKLLAANAMDALEPVFIMGGLVNRSFESMLANAGDTVTVLLPPTMVANNLAETGSVQLQTATPGNTELVLDTHAEASFAIPDVTKALAGGVDLLKMYMKPAMIALAKRIETDLLSHYARLTFNDSVGAQATPLTEATIDKAEQRLFDAYVPETEEKYLIVDSNAYSDLRQIPRFTEVQTSGDGSSMATAKVGKIKNFNVYRSQLVQKSGGTTYNQAFAKDAIGLVTRRLQQPIAGTGAIAEYAEHASFGMRVVMSYNPNTLAQQFTVDCLYGTGILRGQFGLNVKS